MKEREVWDLKDIDTTILRDRNSTIAVVELRSNGEWIQFTGSSKRLPGDRYNPEVGDSFALARALYEAGDYFNNLGKQLMDK